MSSREAKALIREEKLRAKQQKEAQEKKARAPSYTRGYFQRQKRALTSTARKARTDDGGDDENFTKSVTTNGIFLPRQAVSTRRAAPDLRTIMTTKDTALTSYKPKMQPYLDNLNGTDCVCIPPFRGLTTKYFICRDCQGCQHEPCMWQNVRIDDGPKVQFDRRFCNRCKTARCKAYIAEKKAKIEMEEGKKRLYEVVLWRSWCILPEGKLSPKMIEATQTRFNTAFGRYHPIYPPPKEWVREMRSRVEKMMDAASKEVVARFIPDGTEIDDPRVVTHLSDMVMYMLYKHEPKYPRKELGLLGEVVFLVTKGTSKY